MTQSRFRPVKHLKMTVRTSVLWKINTYMAKKWPGMVLQRSFIKGHSFRNRLYLQVKRAWTKETWTTLVFRSIRFNKKTLKISLNILLKKILVVWESTGPLNTYGKAWLFLSIHIHNMCIDSLQRGQSTQLLNSCLKML